jgi:hypothetical protein
VVKQQGKPLEVSACDENQMGIGEKEKASGHPANMMILMRPTMQKSIFAVKALSSAYSI